MAPELGLWWPMSPWLSPGAAWFIFFNALVGAIALMSSRGRGQGQGQDDEGRRRPVRTASTVVLESLRSVSIFSFHPTTADHGVACSAPAASQLHHVQEQYHTFFQEQEAPEVNNRVEPKPASVAEEETLAAAATTATSPAQSAPVAAPAALDESATASKGEVEDGESISLDEAYALARATRQPAVDTVAAAPRKVMERGGACGRGRGAEEAEGKAQVDARAEHFIRQFREGLKLERINSILNYTHALRRTAGAR